MNLQERIEKLEELVKQLQEKQEIHYHYHYPHIPNTYQPIIPTLQPPYIVTCET